MLTSLKLTNRLAHDLLLLVAGLMVVFSFRGDLHRHEVEHACAGVDGRFLHTDPCQSDHYNAHLPGMSPLGLGLGHDHHPCSLCHLLSSGWLVTQNKIQVAELLTGLGIQRQVHWYGHDGWRVLVRGPPLL